MMKPTGIIPAMVTPFDGGERVNEDALRSMTARLIEAGVHGLFCLGTNGEFFSLSADEKVCIAEIIVNETGGRIPVYAGAGCAGTAETAELARRVEAAGVDALSVITPYFLSYTQRELYDHFESVADAVTLPVLLYNIPSRTSNSLQPATVSALSEIPNIVGIKDSSGSFDNILAYIECTPDDFGVLSGTDSLILSVLMAGGTGAIASTANVFPEVVASIYEHWRGGRFTEAEEAQRVLRDLRSAFDLGTLPSVLKAVLNEMGLPAGPARRPVAPLTEEAERKLRQMLDAYEERGWLRRTPVIGG